MKRLTRHGLSFRLSDAWRWSLQVWLLVRIVLSAIGVLLYVTHAIPNNSPYGDLYFGVLPIRVGWQGALLGVWQRWDSVYYMHIVEHGYTTAQLSAFFPLYPLLGSLVSAITGGNDLAALLIISNVAFILALVTLYQIVLDLESPRVAKLAIVAMAVFPVAFYLFAPYAEALAALFTFLTYLLMKRRQWMLAVGAGIGAGLAQPSVIPLAVLLGCVAWQTIRTNGVRHALPAILTTISPLLGLGLFLALRAAHGFPAYTDIQADWGWHIQWPWQTLAQLPEVFTSGTFWIGGWSNLMFLILSIATLIAGFVRLPIELSGYQLAALLFLLITARNSIPLDSFGRHSLTIFPIYIVLGQWFSKTKPSLLVAISTLLLMILTIAYIRWQ
jgi:hypothetical protein